MSLFDLDIAILPTLPANLVGAGPIVVTTGGVTYTLSWDIAAFSFNAVPDYAQLQVIAYNTSTMATERYALSDLQTGFAITAAQITDSTTSGRAVLTGSVIAGQQALEVEPGVDVQAYDAGLTSLASFSTTGSFVYLSAADTWSAVTVGTGLGMTTGTLTWSGVNVRKNSTGSVFTRRRVNFIEGSNITLTVADDAGNDEVDVTIAAAAGTTPVIVDRAFASYATYTNLTATVPVDDTIPQNTEGTQILSVSITPKTTTNRLRIRAHVAGADATTSGATTTAIFSNASANALRAIVVSQPGANLIQSFALEHEYVPGVTSAVTISVRVGPLSGTFWANGNSTSRFLGGASACTLVVEEITA